MRERPILFSGPMILALLAGRKTVTRRVVKPQPTPCEYAPGKHALAGQVIEGNDAVLAQCPYGKPGDLLWVKETWRTAAVLDELSPRAIAAKALEAGYELPWAPLQYEADGKSVDWDYLWKGPGKVRVSIHMPRWASRLTLEVVSVRVERLHDFTDNDAKAEGLSCLTKDGGRTYKYGIPDRDGLPGTDDTGWPWVEWARDPCEAFQRLWVSINGAESWDANPWVWRVEFKRITEGAHAD